MKITDYFKDRSLYLCINLIIFILVALLMYYANVEINIIFLIFCIWFLPLFIYMIIDYIKYKTYFHKLKNTIENLDKKYLLPEVMKEPNNIMEEEMNYIIKELGKDMHEHVKHYRNVQEDYREYIEMWVHEIKTPIASSKLLIENNYNDVTRKIHIQINRIENFVEQVLYYSRSDEVGKDYIIKDVQLSNVVKNVIKKNQRDFIDKKISLQLEHIEDTVYSDPKWIEFILNQIIVNAIKYSKGKEDKIKIESKKENSSVILTVEDSGVGIIDRDINRVFEKGFTGENGRKFGRSTGIGLYLCKKLCDKLYIGISIDSDINKGTKVSLTFPNGENLID